MFSEPPRKEGGFPATAVGIASAAVVILVVVLVLLGRRHGSEPNAVLPVAAYASNLAMSGVEMSESTSLSGGKSTYVDGKIANHGTATVTGITVQVVFKNEQAMPPQLMTEPLTLIRTREPYVDTEPVSAEPLAPGAEKEFRLIFEGVNDNWNQQAPEIRIVGVQTR